MNKYRNSMIVFIILSVAVMVPVRSGAVQTIEWNFDNDKVGTIAGGFLNESGDWKVAPDQTAQSQPNVLSQSAKSTGSAFNLTLVAGKIFKDLDLSVRMKAVSGGEDQGGGLVWRAKDAKNYYIARYNPLEDNYRVYKVKNGRRIELQSAEIKHSDGWHVLRVTMTGENIRCYYDGKEYLAVQDADFRDAGRIGLWTKADARTNFDDLKIVAD
jgi:hypothetical protein